MSVKRKSEIWKARSWKKKANFLKKKRNLLFMSQKQHARLYRLDQIKLQLFIKDTKFRNLVSFFQIHINLEGQKYNILRKKDTRPINF